MSVQGLRSRSTSITAYLHFSTQNKTGYKKLMHVIKY